MKLPFLVLIIIVFVAAAFGRLCVETKFCSRIKFIAKAAAFGRLCVETCGHTLALLVVFEAAAFGRLCVETILTSRRPVCPLSSRLRAAVC